MKIALIIWGVLHFGAALVFIERHNADFSTPYVMMSFLIAAVSIGCAGIIDAANRIGKAPVEKIDKEPGILPESSFGQ